MDDLKYSIDLKDWLSLLLSFTEKHVINLVSQFSDINSVLPLSLYRRWKNFALSKIC